MSLSLQFKINISEKNALTKNFALNAAGTAVDFKTVSGDFRGEFDLMNPKILVESSLTGIRKYNYVEIGALGRKYFITHINQIRVGLCEISCHVDVLSTYATAIRSNSAIIKRQENKWNLYLNDGSFKVYADEVVLTKSFSGGFSNPSFILAVAGG